MQAPHDQQQNQSVILKKLPSYRIAVAGVGYVGFSLAVLLAQQHTVSAVTTTPFKADNINHFLSPIHDEIIECYLSEAKTGSRILRLTATTDGPSAYADADWIIIAVPTNYDPDTNSFDCSSVETVLQTIRQATAHLRRKPSIVIKSTVPVGFTESVCRKYGFDNLLFSPEFLRESKSLYDNLYPSRIVIGCNENTRDIACSFGMLLQQCALKEDIPVLLTGYSEAEAIKLFVNTYLALRVSFFNELDTYAECRALNTFEIVRGVCLDPRVGEYYNNPSFGYGGYCLPKDARQLLANYQDIPENLIRAVVDSNHTRKAYIARQVADLVRKNAAGQANPTVGVFRLTMKSNSDNFRNSAIHDVIEEIQRLGINLVIYEPLLENDTLYCCCKVINNLESFKTISTLIIANRYDPVLDDVDEKVYTRDLFGRD